MIWPGPGWDRAVTSMGAIPAKKGVSAETHLATQTADKPLTDVAVSAAQYPGDLTSYKPRLRLDATGMHSKCTTLPCSLT